MARARISPASPLTAALRLEAYAAEHVEDRWLLKWTARAWAPRDLSGTEVSHGILLRRVVAGGPSVACSKAGVAGRLSRCVGSPECVRSEKAGLQTTTVRLKVPAKVESMSLVKGTLRTAAGLAGFGQARAPSIAPALELAFWLILEGVRVSVRRTDTCVQRFRNSRPW